MAEKIKDAEKILLTENYPAQKLPAAGIMKGAGMFMYDLIRCIRRPIKTDYMILSSYGNSTVSSGAVTIKKDLDYDISGYHILLVEDIVDTGTTMAFLKEYLSGRGALSVKICTMLNKPSRRKYPVEIDCCGFEIPDEFVVGYGVDYAERYRNFPYIAILKREVYTAEE